MNGGRGAGVVAKVDPGSAGGGVGRIGWEGERAVLRALCRLATTTPGVPVAMVTAIYSRAGHTHAPLSPPPSPPLAGQVHSKADLFPSAFPSGLSPGDHSTRSLPISLSPPTHIHPPPHSPCVLFFNNFHSPIHTHTHTHRPWSDFFV